MNQKAVERIREFNRFYTVLIGTLNRHFLGSEFSVTETRVLFEIATLEKCNANTMAEKLKMDKSYMSRILKSFEKRELIQKNISAQDGRVHVIRLTNQGANAVNNLIEKTNRQIWGLISNLNAEECGEICAAMDLITNYLSGKNKERAAGSDADNRV